MSMPKQPNSMAGRARAAMLETPLVTEQEFWRILMNVCATKEQMRNVSNDLRRNGFIERCVRVKP